MNIESTKPDVILIVDDSKANLGVLSDFLDEAGFEIWVARDGESALRKVEYAPPDLILLDVMMPGIDGFETCAKLKASPGMQDIPVIFMTALSDPVDKVKGLSLGAVDYITKPFQQQEVLARIKLHLKLQKLTKTLEQQNALLQKEVAERSAAEAELQKLTQRLEKRVAQRTAELSQSLSELQQAQIQLVNSEKMSSLGQLVAGVAHEINNPVSFIYGNIAHAEEYAQDLIEHLQFYQKYYPDPVPEIKEHAEEIDLDYLVSDLPRMISSMQIGTDRIRTLSQSLRNFCRSDIASKIAVDIHDGLESTLLILQHRLKASGGRLPIEVIKEYGDLPAIECYPGQLNQVFMNIIANAIDALEEAINKGIMSTVSPVIKIRTEKIDSHSVSIRISDNGIGIPEEIKQQIFQAMFTTKPIGKGTGLGLSISSQIVVEKHGGHLKCISQPGQGTEFIITIPIQQPGK